MSNEDRASVPLMGIGFQFFVVKSPGDWLDNNMFNISEHLKMAKML